MLIAQVKPNNAEDLKVQFTLQGFSELGSQSYDVIRLTIPEKQPLIIDEFLTLVDSELWVATRDEKTMLFNSFVYIHGLPEIDVYSMVDHYEIQDAGTCYVNRFQYGENYNDFVSSPLFDHVWVYSSVTPTDTEEEIYDYDD